MEGEEVEKREWVGFRSFLAAQTLPAAFQWVRQRPQKSVKVRQQLW